MNLGARAQVYHHDFDRLVTNNPKLKVVKRKREFHGQIYYYELERLPESMWPENQNKEEKPD